jgi:Fe-Mn family superoxide dismutase
MATPQVVEHILPKLPYAYDALEPFIDKQTVELHHDKHHAAYVTGLNGAEKSLAKARQDNDFAHIQFWSRQFAFHGGGAFLHNLYWNSMAPPSKGGGGEPSGALLEMIDASFGGFAAFKAHFVAAAKAVEASGWCALSYRPEGDRLCILQIENHQKLTPWGNEPILVLDMWEHAFYLKYQNRKDEYVTAWWNVVNWENAQALLKKMRAGIK